MQEEIRQLLLQKAEVEYRDFSSGLIPDSKPLLGVRLPVLRQMAKEIVKKTDWVTGINSYTGDYEDRYFEEVMLRGMIIGYGTQKETPENALPLIRDFILHVDNWSVCDSFCNSLLFAAKNRQCMWEFLQAYLYSDQEFEVRVGVITLLNQYLKYDACGKKCPRKMAVTMNDTMSDTSVEDYQKFPYLERILNILNREYNQGYYAQMAAAWTTAEAFVTFPYETLQLLQNHCQMDNWTYNKALQKICESHTPDEEVKEYIKSLKRKA